MTHMTFENLIQKTFVGLFSSHFVCRTSYFTWISSLYLDLPRLLDVFKFSFFLTPDNLFNQKNKKKVKFLGIYRYEMLKEIKNWVQFLFACKVSSPTDKSGGNETKKVFWTRFSNILCVFSDKFQILTKSGPLENQLEKLSFRFDTRNSCMA